MFTALSYTFSHAFSVTTVWVSRINTLVRFYRGETEARHITKVVKRQRKE